MFSSDSLWEPEVGDFLSGGVDLLSLTYPM